MSKVNEIDELGLGINKRSLLYSKQKNFKKTTQLSHSPTPRSGKSMLDTKYQTMKNLGKTDLKFENLHESDQTPGKSEKDDLINQIQKLNLSLESHTKIIEMLKYQNQELVKTLLNILESFITASKLVSSFTKKVVLEIKTTLVSRLEEFSVLGLDYKNEIEQVSLWGKNLNTEKKAEKTVCKVGDNELHPLNPMKNVHFRSERMVAVFDFRGEMVGCI